MSAIVRFTSVDPLAEKHYSISPYAYCANNPIVMIDPDGLAWFYYSVDGESDPTWNWRDEDEYHTGVKDSKGKEVVLKGFEYLVTYEITGINDEGAEIGTLSLWGDRDPKEGAL